MLHQETTVWGVFLSHVPNLVIRCSLLSIVASGSIRESSARVRGKRSESREIGMGTSPNLLLFALLAAQRGEIAPRLNSIKQALYKYKDAIQS